MYDLDRGDVAEQVDALPWEARAAFEELCEVIRLVPWQSEPAAHDNPDGAVRFAAFGSVTGSGFVYFLVLEDLHRVDLLELVWTG